MRSEPLKPSPCISCGSALIDGYEAGHCSTAGGIPFSAGEAVLERLRANLAKSLTRSEIERIGFSYQTGLAPAGGLLAAQ